LSFSFFISICIIHVGNEMSNSIWERHLPPRFKKPPPSASHAVRDLFIRNKYQLKKYLRPPSDASDKQDRDESAGGGEHEEGMEVARCVEDVLRACETNDISLLLRCLAIAGPECLALPSISSSSSSPLHMAARQGSSACCMLLLVSGVDVLLRQTDSGAVDSITDADNKQLRASEVATRGGHHDLAKFLLAREEEEEDTSRARKTFIEITNISSSSSSSSHHRSTSSENNDMAPGNSSSSSVEDTTTSSSTSTGAAAHWMHQFENRGLQKTVQGLVSKALNSSDGHTSEDLREDFSPKE
jgi:hypothetical protein